MEQERRRIAARLEEVSSVRHGPTVTATVLSEDAPPLDRLFGEGGKQAEIEARVRSLGQRFDAHADNLRFLNLRERQLTALVEEQVQHLAAVRHRERWMVPLVLGSAGLTLAFFVAGLFVFAALYGR